MLNGDIIESIPNKLALHINSMFIISGAGIAKTVHQIHIKRHTNHPSTPITLLLDMVFLPVSICIKKSLNFMAIKFLQIYAFVWNKPKFLLYLHDLWNDVDKLLIY